MFLTTPRSTLPSASVSSVDFFFSAFSSSSSTLRESTMLPRFLFTLMTRMRSSWPRKASRLRTGRTSIWLPGRKARTPISTASPPLMRSMTRPMTTLRSAKAFSTSSQIFIFSAFSRERTTYPSRILGLLEEHVDDIARLDGHLTVLVEKLVDRDDAFRLEPDVDDHLGLGDFQHRALDDLAFRDVPEAVIVDVQQACIFRRVHLLFVVRGS